MERILKSLGKYDANSKIDVLIFPEMALTGYTFTSKEDIKPFCEQSG
jgi:predicted amidohydrolase